MLRWKHFLQILLQNSLLQSLLGSLTLSLPSFPQESSCVFISCISFSLHCHYPCNCYLTFWSTHRGIQSVWKTKAVMNYPVITEHWGWNFLRYCFTGSELVVGVTSNTDISSQGSAVLLKSHSRSQKVSCSVFQIPALYPGRSRRHHEYRDDSIRLQVKNQGA